MSKRASYFKIVKEAQEKVVASLAQSANVARQSADLDENDTISTSALGKQSEASELQQTFHVQYENERTDLEQMMALENRKPQKVEPGAFVETEKTVFYVGMSLRSLPFEGKEILGISLGSPAFNKISDLKVGDAFSLGNRDFKILDIF